jgi:heat shock protein HtpX
MSSKLVATMGLTMFLIFGLIFALIAAVGFYLNMSVFAMVGMGVAMGLIQWLIGPKIIRWSTKMRRLDPKEMPWIEESVHEYCNKNKVKIPEITIAENSMPNAFVFGRASNSATLCLTRGLINNLTKDETKAVIAHEVGHIKHHDMLVMTIVSVIPTIAYYIAMSMMFSGRGQRNNNAGGAILIGMGAFAVYFVTNLMILHLSRLREFEADRFAGNQIRPSFLASALAKITYGLAIQKQQVQNSSLRAFYVVDPVTSSLEVSRFSSYYSDMHISEEEVKKAMDWERRNSMSKFGELFRTHPLTYKRIEALYKLERELNS